MLVRIVKLPKLDVVVEWYYYILDKYQLKSYLYPVNYVLNYLKCTNRTGGRKLHRMLPVVSHRSRNNRPITIWLVAARSVLDELTHSYKRQKLARLNISKIDIFLRSNENNIKLIAGILRRCRIISKFSSSEPRRYW